MTVKILNFYPAAKRRYGKARFLMTVRSAVKLMLALFLLCPSARGLAAPSAAVSRSDGLCTEAQDGDRHTGPARENRADLDFGMSTSLSGPIRAMGESMRAGVEAYFFMINRTGGLNGHRLCLDVLDDSYDPPTAAANTLKLAKDKKILALIGNVGSANAKASLPIATAEKILFYGALSGSTGLRPSPPNRYVINFRASYAEEVDTIIDGMLAIGIKPNEIAVFTQNDAYGDAAYQATVAALKSHGDSRAGQALRGNYPRSTLDVEDALITFLKGPVPPKAIIMAGAYAPSAKFIGLARRVFRDPYFLNLSFVDGASLKKALGAEAEDVIITQVVPPVISDEARDFRQALATYRPGLEPNDISFEGYLAARVFVAGLSRAGKNPSRESIIDGLLSLKDIDIDIGQPIHFDKNHPQVSHKIWPVIARGGVFASFEWESIAKAPY